MDTHWAAQGKDGKVIYQVISMVFSGWMVQLLGEFHASSFGLSIFCEWFQLSFRCFHIKSIKEIKSMWRWYNIKNTALRKFIHFHPHLHSVDDSSWTDEGTHLPGPHSSHPWSEWWSYIISKVPLGFETIVKGLGTWQLSCLLIHKNWLTTRWMPSIVPDSGPDIVLQEHQDERQKCK